MRLSGTDYLKRSQCQAKASCDGLVDEKGLRALSKGRVNPRGGKRIKHGVKKETQSHRGHRVAGKPGCSCSLIGKQQVTPPGRCEDLTQNGSRGTISAIYGSLRRLLSRTRSRRSIGVCPEPRNTEPAAWSVRGRPASVHGSSNRCRRPCRRSSLA